MDVRSSQSILLVRPHESSRAAITYISTCFTHSEQSHVQSFISPSWIAFSFLSLVFPSCSLIFPEWGWWWGSEERGLCECNLSFGFLCFLWLFFSLPPFIPNQISWTWWSLPATHLYTWTASQNCGLRNSEVVVRQNTLFLLQSNQVFRHNGSGHNVWHYVRITFFLQSHDWCLGLFCVGHSFTWREVHLCDFGHSQFWCHPPRSKKTTQTLQILLSLWNISKIRHELIVLLFNVCFCVTTQEKSGADQSKYMSVLWDVKVFRLVQHSLWIY